MPESAYFTERRAARERLLERVGVGSDAGQRLLERWAREAAAESRGTAKQRGEDAAEGSTDE